MKKDTAQDFPMRPLLIKMGAITGLTLIAILLVPDESALDHDDIPSLESQQVSMAAPQLNDGQQAHAYLQHYEQKQVAVEQMMSQAQEFQQQGLSGDAYLLYFKAAQSGHVPAMIALAEQADPLYFNAKQSALFSPDIVQAHKWYQQAALQGSDLAQQRLNDLRAYIQEMAQAGDQKAQLFALQWK